METGEQQSQVGFGGALDVPDRPALKGRGSEMRLLHSCPGAGAAILVLVLAAGVPAQDSGTANPAMAQGIELLRRTRPADAEQVFLRLVESDPGDAGALYYLALSRSLQGRLHEARAGFERVLRLDPRRADACFEIAGIQIKLKDYPSAVTWAERGLRLSPRDDYGLEIAGTAHFLQDSKLQALRYWNRLNRPHLTELRVRPTGSAGRQRIAEEIRLMPGDLLSAGEIEAARWRLRQHRTIRAVRFQPFPGANPDEYSLEVDADARRGVGSWPELLFNTLSSVGFRTWRFSYWDIAGSGVTSSLLWRTRSSARWTQVDIDMPRPGHLPVYAGLSYDWRDESWFISEDSGQGSADFRLRTHEAGLRLLLPLKVPRLSLSAGVAARRRAFEPNAVSPLAEAARGVSWLRFTPVLQLSSRESQSAAGVESRVRGGLDIGRARNPVDQNLSRFSISWENRFDWISRSKLQRTLLAGAHAGRLSEPGLFEDHFTLGVGPDAEYLLRAHPFLRDGRPGSTPMAGSFFLGNITAASDLATWKWLKLGMVGFFDVARMPRIYPGQTIPGTAVDVGIGIELGAPLVPGRKFTLTWGHDTRTGRNTFYLASSFR